MSQAIVSLASAPSHVLHLRRKKVPDELSLPADYVPTDYTSLPPEEPKKRGPNPILIGLVVIAVLGAVVYGVFFMGGTGEITPTEVPAMSLDVSRARMIVSQNKLTTQIDAKTSNAPDGTKVTATLLENDIAFDFFDPEAATAEVAAGEVKFSIPEIDEHENGRASSTYKVQLVMTAPNGQTSAPVVADLELTNTAKTRFLGADGGADPTATPAPTITIVIATPGGDATATPPPVEQPTAPPVGSPPVPLENIVISRPGIVYESPYGPTNQRGSVNAGEISKVVVKLPVNGETWYLAVVPATGVAGWINSNVIDLPASDVNKITPVSGDAPFAVVFNGGNVRSAPGGTVVTTVDAGINVRLQERTADNGWFKIQLPSGEAGWVSAALLTINPSVRDSVTVAP